MAEMKNKQKKCLLLCDEICVGFEENGISSLARLQTLIRLKALNLNLQGNNASIIRMKYASNERDTVMKEKEKTGDILILDDQDAETVNQKKRWGTQTIRMRELVAAVSGNELFFMIDHHLETFHLLDQDTSAAMVDKLWREQKHIEKSTETSIPGKA